MAQKDIEAIKKKYGIGGVNAVVVDCCKSEPEIILETFELKIQRYLKETDINERDDLEQEMKIKIIEKIYFLTKEESPSFIEFALEEII